MKNLINESIDSFISLAKDKGITEGGHEWAFSLYDYDLHETIHEFNKSVLINIDNDEVMPWEDICILFADHFEKVSKKLKAESPELWADCCLFSLNFDLDGKTYGIQAVLK